MKYHDSTTTTNILNYVKKELVMGKKYIVQYCTKCTEKNGEETFEYLECIDNKGKVQNFTYAEVLRLMQEKKSLFFIVVNGIHSLVYADKEHNGKYVLRSASDTEYLNYVNRIPIRLNNEHTKGQDVFVRKKS